MGNEALDGPSLVAVWHVVEDQQEAPVLTTDPGETPTPSSRSGDRYRRAFAALTRWARSAVAATDALQVVKATTAAVLSWVLADSVLGLHQPFLAPWVALLTVHATVQRTVRRGVETVASVAAGIVLSFVVLQVFGPSTLALTIALLAGLALARLPWVRHEGTLIATTALFVITTGEQQSQGAAIDVLPDRLLDTALGVGVALAVNLLVVPPLDDRSAQEQVDRVNRRLGELLTDMASEVSQPTEGSGEGDWIERTRSIDGDLDQAWSLVSFSDESRRLNPRRRLHDDSTPAHLGDVLIRLEEGVAQARSIARHILETRRAGLEWDPRFRDRYLPLLAALGRSVAEPNPDVAPLRQDVGDLVADLSDGQLPRISWPVYGALLANTMTIVEVVDDVASARPVRT